MNMLSGAPGFFAGVTGEAGILELASRKTYTPGLHKLLVAGEALPVGGGAVLPGGFVDDIAVAGHTGTLLLDAKGLNGGGFLQIMTEGAALGQLVILMKEIGVLAQRFQVKGCMHWTIREFQTFPPRIDGEVVCPRLKRQPEMQVVILLMLNDHYRL
jgi:hypothetical protein